MNSLSLEQARVELANLLQAEPTMIYSENGQRGVVMSMREFSKMSAAELESWQETMYLLANPANERHLLESIKQHRNGEALARGLIDL